MGFIFYTQVHPFFQLVKGFIDLFLILKNPISIIFHAKIGYKW